MNLKKLYSFNNEPMRVAGLMSGSGSNLEKIIDYGREFQSQRGILPYEVVVIFTDNPYSNARNIGERYGIPVVARDLVEFCDQRGTSVKDPAVREEFDRETVKALQPYDIDVAAYAGYMRIATLPLIHAFLGVNVHPADLTIMDGDRRKYTGDKAVRKAILAGETHLRSTTHLVEKKVDYGRVLMLSCPLSVDLPPDFDRTNEEHVKTIANSHQDRLKRVGDWKIFPLTLGLIAEGSYQEDEQGNLYFNDLPIPNGVRLG